MPYSKELLTNMFRRLGANGTAPEEGCELFGVGYDDAFKRLLSEYVEDALPSGGSAEKFVIGPYGSGKTHFLRHFMTLARERGCVTSEIQLNKDIDYTKTLVVYREVAARIKMPGGTDKGGIKALLKFAVEKPNFQFQPLCSDDMDRREQIESWISALDDHEYKFDQFGHIVQKALRAYIQKNIALFDALSRWLQGEVDNKQLIKDLPSDLYLKPKSPNDNLFAGNLMLSLCQFIRYAGFKGTIIGLDEAEQGLDVNRRKQNLIMSMLQANINAVADLKEGSVLILYAFTPDLESRFSTYPALQQRIDVPADQDFFKNGNTLAAKIDLTRRDDPVSELKEIGHHLADLFYKHFGNEATASRAEVIQHVEELANQVVEKQLDSGNRRTMVKEVCAYLWKLRNVGEPFENQENPPEQGEV